VLADRYRLIDVLGSGSSAEVYLAEDQTFGRLVAVKVSHEVLAGDEAFRERFRAEARAVAALHHPHLTTVFDWGEDGAPFIVMEHLAGGSLRRMVDSHGPRTSSQVLVIGLEAARGLDAAHGHGLVHRNIKPENLLFDREGRLHIADFGMARALADAATTEPLGVVMETARYLSPEQVGGGPVDGRSDVFSLALVMVEALTLEAPFQRDTTGQTLAARVHEPLAVPAVAGPLAGVIAWAGSTDPTDRPDAGELAVALLECATKLERPEPLPIDLAPVPGGVRVGGTWEGEPPVPTRWGRQVDSSTITPLPSHSSSPSSATRVSAASVPSASSGAVSMPYDFMKEDTPDFIDLTGPSPVIGSSSAPGHQPPRRTHRTHRAHRTPRTRWARRAVIAMVLAAVAAAVIFSKVDIFHVGSRATTPVPELSGRPITEVEKLAIDNGWSIDKTEGRADGSVPGHVLRQSPAAGTQLARGDMLQIEVSLGQTLAPVPSDLAGKKLNEVRGKLFFANFGVGDIQRQPASTPAETVIGVAPGTPAELPKGSNVGLVVSSGPAGKGSTTTSPPPSRGSTRSGKTKSR